MKTSKIAFAGLLGLGLFGFVVSCDENDTTPSVHNPDTAPAASIDRFSGTAGHLFQRASNANLPAADAAISFDQEPFRSMGLGPDGQEVEYYNFDAQPVEPAPIYVLFKEGSSSLVEGQLNIVDAIPGDEGYNDFWRVYKVTVPDNYIANQVASLSEIMDAGYAMSATPNLVNCPVVPDGSTANLRLGSGSSELHQGWYKEMAVYYFTFDETALQVSGDNVPTSPIFVTFNTNGDASSGFKTETGTTQTHNVVATVPGDTDYSPLWVVNVYDNTEFSNVTNLISAEDATILAQGAAIVNCPLIYVE